MRTYFCGMPLPEAQLREFLEAMVDRYNRNSFVPTDPISIPHQFSRAEDIEISAFLTATIAWGQRPTIMRNAQWLVERMDLAPYDFISQHTAADRRAFDGFVHRTFNGEDCRYFLQALQLLYREHGGLHGAFRSGFAEVGNRPAAVIGHVHDLFFSLPDFPARTKKHVSDPRRGSAAKRLNMYLRWMVRQDNRGVDFGLWSDLNPAHLYLPLDVHTANVARKLELLTRKQNDWRAVEEITQRLRTFDPADPVKYDFALFGLGAFEGF